MPERPPSRKRKAADATDVRGLSPSPISRPATSSAAMITPDNHTAVHGASSGNYLPPPSSYPRNMTRLETPNSNGSGRRFSVLRLGGAELSSPQENMEEARRDSISSRGSWIRRLSTIPISGQNSPRSSVGPESPSLTFSNTSSAVPILSSTGNSPAQLPPNKLVKRQTSEKNTIGGESRNRSKTLQTPTLRRPATSHQRSVTLKQQFQEDSPRASTQIQPASSPPKLPSQDTPLKKRPSNFFSRTTWRMYFDSRPTKLTKERHSGRSSDGGVQNFQSTSRRVMPNELVKPTLLKPAMITISKMSMMSDYEEDDLPLDDEEKFPIEETILPTTEESPKASLKRARRSLSMHFSSPGSWLSRSGSLRGKKTNDNRGAKRYSSAPVTSIPGRNTVSAHGPGNHRHKSPIMDPTLFQRQLNTATDTTPHDPFAPSGFQTRNRNSSSPLPPLSRLSSFNVDLARLGLSSSSSSAPRRSPNSPPLHVHTAPTSFTSTAVATPTSSPYFGSVNSRPARTSEVADRASTLVGSDNDAKGFVSGDDDDMDFQSETVYDSLRSGATGSVRSQHTPLDTMFDESPPSVNSHLKSKRISIHELMGNGAFGEKQNRIVEEDEGTSTPVKGPRTSQDDSFATPVRKPVDVDVDSDERFPSSPPSFCLATKDFSRISFGDEEEDEDWTRDDENLDMGHQLSPPNSSLNSQRVSASFRAALADVTHTNSANGNPSSERPKSNLFDWSEPSNEKLDAMGNSARPATAHAKNLADGRGGRTVGRRGPTALHIRSQSVPVVPDNGHEHTKLTPKFGTWGLGAKGVSEDWDNDFEFESPTADADDGDKKIENSSMFVPPAIQASQANVVGHVGQIREVCLLVEDLKRLRLLGREKGLLNGGSEHLWKEAEGIIALAVPDEEDPTLSPPHSPSIIFESEKVEDDYVDQGVDSEDIARPEAPMEVLNRHGKPTGFVYDGNTVRRRSVFSPDDDIFGAGAVIHNPPIRDSLRPPSASPRHSSARNSADVARSVMETMHQHRSTSDPLLSELTTQSANKMPFDTTSLRDLVHRASVLTRKLADIIREADEKSQSPDVSPRRQRESSPAFTRVFTDPMTSPPKHLLRSHSNNSMLSGSIDSSPSRNLGQRMHMMTVV